MSLIKPLSAAAAFSASDAWYDADIAFSSEHAALMSAVAKAERDLQSRGGKLLPAGGAATPAGQTSQEASRLLDEAGQRMRHAIQVREQAITALGQALTEADSALTQSKDVTLARRALVVLLLLFAYLLLGALFGG